MHKIKKLKENLLEELEHYADKKDYNMEDITVMKYLSSAVDHLCNVVKDAEDEEYSERSYREMPRRSYESSERMSRRSYDDGRGGSYDDGMSGARGRRNAPRDSMGRYSGDGYSRAGEMAEKLREMGENVPDDSTRNEIMRLANRMAQM